MPCDAKSEGKFGDGGLQSSSTGLVRPSKITPIACL
jgi:hypothetical protein